MSEILKLIFSGQTGKLNFPKPVQLQLLLSAGLSPMIKLSEQHGSYFNFNITPT